MQVLWASVQDVAPSLDGEEWESKSKREFFVLYIGVT